MIKIGDIDFLQCPFCGHCVHAIYPNRNNMAECYKCNKKSHRDKWKIVTMKRPFVICKICGTEVFLMPENLNGIGCFAYICPNCENSVATKFGDDLLELSTLMKLKWNKDIIKRAIQIENDLFFSLCKNEKDFLILKIMQLMAKEEDTGFLYIDEGVQKACFLFDIKKETYIGFMVWTENAIWTKNKSAIIGQIFIMKEEREKGYGTKLLEFWVKNFADKINNEFGVESPNEKMKKILVKLGYAKFEGKNIEGIKCFFVHSPM